MKARRGIILCLTWTLFCSCVESVPREDDGWRTAFVLLGTPGDLLQDVRHRVHALPDKASSALNTRTSEPLPPVQFVSERSVSFQLSLPYDFSPSDVVRAHASLDGLSIVVIAGLPHSERYRKIALAARAAIPSKVHVSLADQSWFSERIEGLVPKWLAPFRKVKIEVPRALPEVEKELVHCHGTSDCQAGVLDRYCDAGHARENNWQFDMAFVYFCVEEKTVRASQGWMDTYFAGIARFAVVLAWSTHLTFLVWFGVWSLESFWWGVIGMISGAQGSIAAVGRFIAQKAGRSFGLRACVIWLCRRTDP